MATSTTFFMMLCCRADLYAPNSGSSSGSSSSSDYKNNKCKYTGQSVRALPVRILTVGKKRSPGVQLIVDDYVDKLRIYCAVEDIIHVRSNPKNARDTVTQVNDEDMAVMNLIRPDDWVVILDERGKDLRSEHMAELIGDAGNQGSTKLLFCIGGPYGHGRRLRERANVSVKLSSMVLNHQIALVVLMEQLYSVCFKVMDNYQGTKVSPLRWNENEMRTPPDLHCNDGWIHELNRAERR